MKVLEVAPLEDTRLVVYIVEKEYNEPFRITESPSTQQSRKNNPLFRVSIVFHKFLERLVKKVAPDFITEELGMRREKKFYEDNVLTEQFQLNNIPFFPVDIDENAVEVTKFWLDWK